jgi:coenzyme F420-reducing hydrogenase alpha subunit
VKIEGRLEIDLYRDAARIRDVSIHSTRPFKAVTLFWGKPVEDVLETLPLLYSVCSTAQAMAAVTACEQAMAIEVSDTQLRARDLLVRAETVREHMFRILLDWPAFTGRKSSASLMAPMNGLPGCLRKALYPRDDPFQLGGGAVAVNRHELDLCLEDARRFVETQIFALEFEAWKRITDETALKAWAARSDSVAAALIQWVMTRGWSDFGRSTITGLPALNNDELHERMGASGADTFISQPLWRGVSHETTPFTRQHNSPLIRALHASHGNGLLPRLVARLHELVTNIDTMCGLAAGLERDSARVAPGQDTGSGVSQVEAARGRLIHRVEIGNSRVRRYQIVAPTEWNFHPRGLLACSLGGRTAADRDTLFKQAMLLVNAIDPCVDYRIRVH